MHEIIGRARDPRNAFDVKLFIAVLRLTKVGFGHMDVKTTGERPTATTAFAMLCRQKLKAHGVKTELYVSLVRHMVEHGALSTEVDHRGSTPLLLAAGSNNGLANNGSNG